MDLKSGILLLMLAGTTTSAGSSPDAVAFVRATYAQYSDTMLGPTEEQTYSPELLAMIVADKKKAGGEGAFEADQLCQMSGLGWASSGESFAQVARTEESRCGCGIARHQR